VTRRAKRPWSPSYWALAWELTRTEFKLRDQGTVLGFFWTLLHPALMFLVLHALFIKWFGRHVEDYPSYLLIGLVQWQFFEKSTTAGLSSLRRKSALLRNFDFAREIVVLSSVGAVFLSFALELAVMLAFLAWWGGGPSASWLAAPALALLSLAVSAAASLVLALVSAEFEDLERIWALLLTAGFYLTPVFYPLHLISEDYHGLMALNPMLHVIGAWRACLLAGGRFDAGGAAAVAVAAGAVIAASLMAFRRWERWVSDRVIAP
jgi:lipopolysaccharide transport system permease protein